MISIGIYLYLMSLGWRMKSLPIIMSQSRFSAHHTIEIATRMIKSGNVALYDIANYTELPLSKVEDLAEK